MNSLLMRRQIRSANVRQAGLQAARLARVRPLLVTLAAWLVLVPVGSRAQPQPVAPPAEPLVREIFVPFDELDILLDGSPQRVFLTRPQYEDLLRKASRQDVTPPPVQATVLSAQYQVQLEQGRALLTGELQLDVLGSGLQAIALNVSGVGIRRALLDGQPAPLVRGEGNQVLLLAEGPARRTLQLELTAPLQTSAAQQSLQIEIPLAPISRLRVAAPGNVELKSGADVLERQVAADQSGTTFELSPQQGPLALVLSLNNRLLRKDRVMLARSVMIDEIATGVERLQALVSLTVLHGAAERFDFQLSQDFEITDVACDQLARWNAAPQPDGLQKVGVELRQPVTGTTTVRISAVRLKREDQQWSFPTLKPLDVAGHVAVLGLMVEQGMETRQVHSEQLIPIDLGVLEQAFAAALHHDEGALPTRPLLAYYAPQADYSLQAQFEKPPQQLQVVTSLVLQLSQQRQEVTGVFSLRPQVEKLFSLVFLAPPQWDVAAVRDAAGNPLAFERFARAEGGTMIQLRLPQAVAPGQAYAVEFQALRTAAGWLGDWQQQVITFPDFQVEAAAGEVGAIAVVALDDLQVRPDTLNGLSPLNDDERQQFGLDKQSDLAFRFDARPFGATFLVEHVEPNLTARVLALLKVGSEGLNAQYEFTFTVRQASTRRLRLSLPDTTPPEVVLRGLGSTVVKEYNASVAEGRRIWDVLLAEKIVLDENQTGQAQLALAFQQPLAEQLQDYALPLARAEDVQYQSGLIAIEEDAELDTTIRTDARAVDIGELTAAQFSIGRRVLGSYGYVGAPPRVAVDVVRQPGHQLPPAIVERAELLTAIAASGKGQTSAKYHLRTKALLLEIRLPKNAELWSVLVDQQPATPQRSGQSLLVSLPAAAGETREIEIAFAFSTGRASLWGEVDSAAPRLLLPGSQAQPAVGPPQSPQSDEAVQVPIADVQWKVLLPKGYIVTQNHGTVEPTRMLPTPTANPFALTARTYGLLGAARHSVSAPTALSSRTESDGLRHFSEHSTFEQEGLPGAPQAGNEPATSPEAMDFELPSREAMPPPAAAEPGPDLYGMAGGGQAVEATEVPAPSDAPPQEPLLADTTAATPQPAAEQAKSEFTLAGVRSLRVDLQNAFEAAQSQQVLEFRSLGDDPLVKVRILHRTHLLYLAWATGLVVALIGVLLTDHPWRTKLAWLALVVVLALVLPGLTGWTYELHDVVNAAVLAAALLLPYYLVMAVIRLFLRLGLKLLLAMRRLVPTAAVLVLSILPMTGYCQQAMDADELSELLKMLPPPAPITLPADAVLIPYDPQLDRDPREQGDRLLIPYEKYVELWNRAYPHKPIGGDAPPVEYAIADTQFTATLAGEQDLAMQATITLESFVDRQVAIQLPFAGGVIVRATLDGAAARLQLVGSADAPRTEQPVQQAVEPNQGIPAPPPAMLLVYLEGKGRRVLQLDMRLSLERQGGWRRVEAHLPMGPSGRLSLQIPEADTEVRLKGVADRNALDTDQDNQSFETALLPGPLSLQWRPKVAEAEVDAALTAESAAVLDVQEDGLRLAWRTTLQFRRGQRDEFAFRLPAEYLIEKVVGNNIRGWSAEPLEGRQRVVVTLLRPATGSETITLLLSRRVAFDPAQATPVTVPAVEVEDTALHQGTLTIRRSPLLDLRTAESQGVSRTETDPQLVTDLVNAGGVEERPLPALAFQSFRFTTPAYAITLEARTLAPRLSVETQAILRISERTSDLEAQFVLMAEQVPVHLLRIDLPPTLEIQQISEPQWALTDAPDGAFRTLTIYLAAGRTGTFSLALRGSLGSRSASDPVPLPVMRVAGATRHEGQLVVQTDPAYRVRAEQLQGAEVIPLEQTFGWLHEQQRNLARTGLSLGLRGAEYSGQLLLTRREPVVNCTTLTNVHFTPRAIEETILLEFRVQEAGIQQLAFLLPERMRDARLKVPALRQKTIEPVADGDPDRPLVRFQIELQDELMDVIRIVVEHDQVLSPDPHEAPVPLVETGQVDHQYVTLQNSSRDEVVLVTQTGVDELARQQDRWRELADLDVTQGYVVQGAPADVRLVAQTKPRQTLQTVSARIGLSETVLVVDTNGSYRAAQVFRVENTTEQYLELTLPEQAVLWSVQVAGEPVKPTRPPADADPHHVQIPLVKTETGDADYPVRIVYAGKLDPLDQWRRVQFPLARSTNIRVELNQVTLHLPESHQWLDFRGARHLRDQADYAVGFEIYLNDQLQKAKQAADSANRYDRLRARNNLKSLALALESTRQKYQDSYASDSKLSDQNTANLQLLQQAEQQLDKQEHDGVELQILDNRGQLQKTFEEQNINRSRNVVINSHGNFDYNRRYAEEPQQQAQFNDKWFDQNQLATAPPEVSAKSAAKPEAAFAQQGPESGSGAATQEELRDLGAAIQQRRSAAESKKDAERSVDDQLDLQFNQRSFGYRTPQMGGFDAPGGGAGMGGGGVGGAEGPREGQMPGLSIPSDGAQTNEMRAGRGTLARSSVTATVQGLGEAFNPIAAETGLSSLDLEIPLRGKVYYFSAARGKTTISAQAVPASWIDRTLRVALGMVIALVAIWALRRR